MRILMAGALSIQYIRDNWVEPMERLYDCVFVDLSPLLSVYKNGYHQSYLLNILRSGGFDYLFFYADALNMDFTDDFFTTVRACGIPVVSFYADDEPEIWYAQNEPFDHRFDLVATPSLRGLQRRREKGKAGEFLYLPWGYNPSVYHPLPGIEKCWDVVYIGGNSVHLENPSLYLNDGVLRQELLSAACRYCEEQGLSFHIFGPRWELHPLLGGYSGGIISQEEMVRVYNQAKIVLNPGFAADNEAARYQTKLRHFEAAGCGAFQLVNDNPELAALFNEGKDIAFFHTIDDMKEKIGYYVERDDERQEMARRALITAQEYHTTDERLATLFERACLVFPIKEGKAGRSGKRMRVHTVYTAGESTLWNLLEDFARGRMVEGNWDLLHVLDSSLAVRTLNYRLLDTLSLSGSFPLVGIRSFLQLASLHDNTIQRKKENILGLVLAEKVHQGRVGRWVAEYLKEITAVVEDGDYLIPLMNYLIPRDLLQESARVFLEGSSEGFGCLPVYYSGLVVVDGTVAKDRQPAGADEPPFIGRLRRLLGNASLAGTAIAIYGGRGTMADKVFALLKEFPGLPVIGIVDRSVTEKTMVGGLPVYKYEDLARLNPDMIVIAADNSGPRIYEAIRHLEGRTAIVPLYNLSDPVWDVLMYE